ncbi:hypothetical protein SAMN05661096_02911 [Marivirga sericea]|uniref:Uncharacterized protein n=1 Tax=Marivirga sericea TaxID=1028 RepID=A0A1X7KN57_9BACT|nr:hypothetical protein [Marivirga sericea]SMG42635.1 hypothetical protein SAMN05661096_02911 [Marivirga sericea]
MSKKPLSHYLESQLGPENKERNRTLNVPESLHSFFKKASSNYDIGISTLIYNVLTDWKNEYENDIIDDMLIKFRKNGL